MTDTDGDLRLKLENKKKDTTKITYRVQRYGPFTNTGRMTWRMTLFRLEWFPRLRTWRLMETRADYTIVGHTYWQQIILVDFGDVSEYDACAVACSSLRLLGKP